MANTTTTVQQQFTNAILMAMDKMKEIRRKSNS